MFKNCIRLFKSGITFVPRKVFSLAALMPCLIYRCQFKLLPNKTQNKDSRIYPLGKNKNPNVLKLFEELAVLNYEMTYIAAWKNQAVDSLSCRPSSIIIEEYLLQWDKTLYQDPEVVCLFTTTSTLEDPSCDLMENYTPEYLYVKEVRYYFGP